MELIDTLWNVNEIGIKYAGSEYTELIDTLWNVNVLYQSMWETV